MKSDFWYLASYPKSGNTWVRIFISELINIEKGIDANKCNKNNFGKTIDLNKNLQTGLILSSRKWFEDQTLLDTGDLSQFEIDNIRCKIGNSTPVFYKSKNRFHKVHDAFTSPNTIGKPIVPTKRCKGVVYIIRNPFDVAVSLSHYFSMDLERSVKFLLNKNASIGYLSKFRENQLKQYLGTWSNHVNSWTNQNKIPLLAIKYEDLINKGETYFRKIASFLKISDNHESINLAIKNSSFSVVKKKERLYGFQENENKNTFFFRKGQVGEGKKMIKPEYQSLITNEFKDVLRKFDY